MIEDASLLLIGGFDDVVRKAKKLGLRVLLCQHPAKITDTQRALADELHLVDFTDWAALEPLVRLIHQRSGFTAAVSLTEAGLANTARINDLFGLGSTSYDVVRLSRDKWAMRQHLATVDPDAVAAAAVNGQEDLAAFGARHGYPFIVKPVDATASFAVFRVDGPQQLPEVWDAIEGLLGTRTDRSQFPFLISRFVMEEYLDGPEFSVESFSFGGRHVIIAITEKFVEEASFTELAHVVPARVSPAQEVDIRNAVCRFLDHLGVRDGVGHTEIRMCTRGPAVIETHNRPGGDAITDLVGGAYGIDLISYALGWPFGLVPELPDRPEPVRAASTRFLVSPVDGVIAAVDGAAAALAEPDVLCVQLTAQVGNRARPVRDNWDRLGLIAVTGADADAALARGAEVARELLAIGITADDGSHHLAPVAEIRSRAHL